jgi:CheY-like chemotaxis protein
MADPRRILLVEDNDDNLSVYRAILEHTGYEVIEARDGEAGVAQAKDGQPDLILMDISLPRLDGYEATRILKRDPRTRHIPIIALTAHALEEDRERARDVGCDGFLAKPIEPSRVVREVGRYLSRV